VSENDYVATAAAEKRLREVLADRMPGATLGDVEQLAVILLDGARIEYKSRAKQVTISLDLPETAATKRAEKPTPEPTPDTGPADPEPEITQAPPQPHIAPFQPKHDPDADYEDVHYD
jgi:hypothetical protein